ncbi:MAG: extracellular solute-binding protein [Spirochaetaceae bacterium]|jgi:raffinose/stachyose/melibiose transport system substrate-binding protein|nr:extracellular solute-binding protein [Spirochaetaceae bacterium]
MKKLILTALVIFSVVNFTFATGGQDKGTADGKVKLVFTSWRTEDIERMNRINEAFTKENPNIEIDFQPVKDTEYDSQLKQSLAAGVGADIIFLRSYDSGYQIYKTDSLMELNSVLPELKDFPSAAVAAWATEGKSYGIPAAGVVHGVYYRKSIFKKYGLSVPATWDEFMAACKTLKAGGETVFAQGTKDNWMLYEVMYSGLGANFYGGEKARQALMNKTARFTDDNFVLALEKMKELQPYFPDNYEGIDYVTMQQIFGTGNAAMFIGGSWEIGIFEDLGGLEDVGYFAPPLAKAGDTLQYCFHVDAGIAMNKNTQYPEEAKKYMKWLASPEYAQLYMNELPGFFSYTPGKYTLSNQLAKEMQSYVAASVPTVRTVWEKLSAQAPSGNELVGEAIQMMYANQVTPEEAAKLVDDGLSWYYK